MEETKYKQTEVGLIPEEWECKSIGEVGNTYAGLTGKSKQDFVKGNALYITFLNVLNNPILKPELFESVYVGVNERQNKAQRGDLFFNTSSETPEEVGICAMLDEDFRNLYLNSFCFGYRLKDNSIIPLFLSYYFRSDMGRRMMTAAAQGVTRYNLSKSTFNKIKIPLPPLAEQHAIASALTSIDNLIASLDKQIAKTKSVKEGAMQQLLTGKTRLKGFSESWKEKRVCDTCETIPVKLKLKTSDYLSIGKYPIIDQGQDYICGYTNIDGTMPAGEYILFGDHTCCVKYVDFPFVQGADGLKVLKTSDNSKFIYYLLCNIRIDVSYNRHWSALKEMDILVPTSLAEQHAIASALTAIDDQISALEAKRKKYEMVKVGMMQQLLTGKIRLS